MFKSEAAVRRCSIKKLFEKFSEIHKNIPVIDSEQFLIEKIRMTASVKFLSESFLLDSLYCTM